MKTQAGKLVIGGMEADGPDIWMRVTLSYLPLSRAPGLFVYNGSLATSIIVW